VQGIAAHNVPLSQAAALTVGAENVEPNTPPIAGAEDFAFMLERSPALT
jgi:hypothetical protein